MYSNSRNDVPRVAQRYGIIAAYKRRRASVLVVFHNFVLFSMHMHSFAGLIRRSPPPTFSDTAITDRHFDTTIFQLRAHWVRMFYWIGKIVRTCAPGGSRTLDFLRAGRAPYPLGQALRFAKKISRYIDLIYRLFNIMLVSNWLFFFSPIGGQEYIDISRYYVVKLRFLR